MSLKDFKLISEADDSYHLQSANGRKFAIEKKKLNEKAHAAIKELKQDIQKFANGLEVQPAPTLEEMTTMELPIGKSIEPKKIGVDKVKDFVSNTVSSLPSLVDKAAAEDYVSNLSQNNILKDEPVIVEPTKPIIATEPVVEQNVNPILNTPSASDEYEKTLKQGAKLVSSNANSEANILRQTQNDLADMQTDSEIKAEEQRNKDDAFEKALESKKVDPDRIFKQGGSYGSLGNKILAGIGVLLSGAGAGLTGQKNLAVEAIDNAINRDIDAQKNDQNKQLNLWKMNKAAYQSDVAADLSTKNQYLAIVNLKLKEQAARAIGPQQKNIIDQALALSKQEQEKNSAIIGLITSNNKNNTEDSLLQKKELLTRAALNNPKMAKQLDAAKKELLENYIPGKGTTTRKVTDQLIKEVVSYDDLDKLFDEAINFREKNSGRLGSWNPETRKQGQVLSKAMADAFNPLFLNIHRSSPETVKQMRDMIGDVSSMDLFKGQLAGLKQLKELVEKRKATVYDNYGLNPFEKNNSGVSADQTQSYINYAKQHPEDPNSKKILKTFGSN